MTGTWVTLVALAAVLLVTGVVALDRNRIKRKLEAAEGELAGLRLDLAAARDAVDSPGPVPDRWSPAPGQGVAADTAEATESRRLSGH